MTKLKPSSRHQDQKINQSCEASLVWCNIVQGSFQALRSLPAHYGILLKHMLNGSGTAEENAFQAVKRQLTQAPVMAFFKQGAETRVITDSSPVGIGAVLQQKQEDGQYRPVHYASRKLTPPESRYSQFEREALAVKWSCKKFFLYIHGNEFEICTDHKPLTTVLGPHSKPPSARIERWMLYMQQFKYNIRHIPGKENAADAISRLPVDSAADATVKQTEEYARTIVADAIPAALTPQQIERESERDPTLQLVRHAITSGDWSKLQGTTYKAVRDELWIMGQLVMRGKKVVMPEKLWNQTIQLAHDGHQGMVRTKSRLREKVWWPDLDKQVEKLSEPAIHANWLDPDQSQNQ